MKAGWFLVDVDPVEEPGQARARPAAVYFQLNGLAVWMTAFFGWVLSYEVCSSVTVRPSSVGRPGREHEVWCTLDGTC